MKKNMNENFEITVDEMTEIFGDTPVEMSFREVKEGMDSFFGLMGLTVELVNLIRKEDELKKHHRAYLHVREEIAECANEATEVIAVFLTPFRRKNTSTVCPALLPLLIWMRKTSMRMISSPSPRRSMTA